MAPITDPQPPPRRASLERALERIAATAAQRDRSTLAAFPADAFAELRGAGALAFNARAGDARPPAAGELDLVRRIAAADGSVGRIFDGHLNAVERIAVQAPAAISGEVLAAVHAGELLGGVWGGDPVADEGEPATVVSGGSGEVLRGVKTFCSGAGGCTHALVLARDGQRLGTGMPVLVWLRVRDDQRVQIDPGWYRARGLTASVSHRVVFHDAPVIARVGPPGAITAQPWLGRDALRTAASWAGMADTAVTGMRRALRERGAGELESLAMGRVLTAQRTIDVWLAAAAVAMDTASDDVADLALHGRAAIAAACRHLLDEAARACGSRPFARADALDRARRDLELFLLQHRLDPMLARAGAAALADGVT